MKGRDLRVTLTNERAVAAYTAPFADDDEHQGEVEPERAVNDIDRGPLDAVRVLEQWLRKWEWIAQAASRGSIRRQLLVPETFRVLGDLLWQIAFSGDVGTLLRTKMAEARHDDESPLRVRLGFGDGADDLTCLPWEFLRCPAEDIFLAQEHSIVLARFVDGPPDTTIMSEDHELRVMFVIALPTTNAFREERDELRRLVDDGLRPITKIDLTPFETWDRNSIIAALKPDEADQHIDVLHLVAVCSDEKLTSQGLPSLHIPGVGLADPAQILAILTAAKVPPTLVVLHLSEDDKDPSAHFEMLAPAFIRKGVPAVLAMQYPMPPDRGREFLASLYDGLARGQQVGSTIHEARALLAGDEWNRQFGTPVLYLQSREDGRLLRPSISVDDAVEAGMVAQPSARREPTDGAQVRTAKALTGEKVAKRLSRMLDQYPDAHLDLVTWLQQRRGDWPDDLDAIAVSLRAQQRQLGNSREADRQISRLLHEVARMSGAIDG